VDSRVEATRDEDQLGLVFLDKRKERESQSIAVLAVAEIGNSIAKAVLFHRHGGLSPKRCSH